MRFDIITLFPDFFHGPFDYGVVARALSTGLAEAHLHDLRAFTHDRHRTVDDRPFGGGEGMVLKPQPIFECLESLGVAPKPGHTAGYEPAATMPATTVILLSAQGRRFTQATARQLVETQRVVLICGRYEGVDERVSQLLCDRELSIGDYVLSGGELAAAVVVDAVVRLLPGVLGHADSSRYESFGEGDDISEDCHPQLGRGPQRASFVQSSASEGPNPGNPHDLPRSTHASGGLLDYPHYTRPADFRGIPIPAVLSSGDHLAIRRWRRQAALAKTLANRPDLLQNAPLSEDDRAFLANHGFSPPTQL